MYPQGRHPTPLQSGQPFKFSILEICDRIKEEFQFLQAQYHSSPGRRGGGRGKGLQVEAQVQGFGDTREGAGRDRDGAPHFGSRPHTAHARRLECEKLASEKTEMQRHYVMARGDAGETRGRRGQGFEWRWTLG
ncbi:hypothetical protein P7K49_032905 [Saguinus oedipus]|uniref:Groucho/TLE N-terminal Q-rich domain-containing protein n=1 Tax=Saguinus oedipus TaxID=9490 RepID=A0ABQ9TQD7_SAGOE|nr:hypothetical protein P7K49_032905 [Saguinus oedipus]